MTTTDILILILVIAGSVYSYYSAFIKHKHTVCASCHHIKRSKKGLQAYYKKVRDL